MHLLCYNIPTELHATWKASNSYYHKAHKRKQREKVSYPRIYSKTAVFLCQTREIYSQNINRRKAILGFGELLYIMD